MENEDSESSAWSEEWRLRPAGLVATVSEAPSAPVEPMVMLGAKTRIQQALFDLGTYELEVVAEFAARVLAGQRQYGKFDPATETRDMNRERYEEQLDDQVYAAYLAVLRRVRAAEETTK